ncbi:phenylalanine--tRNA ligase subunit beta [Fimbriiglobus ruber]|uniref:Phenylalanine--tRNA ligase beta subunit n=1 Tax=Fimbriiglobus ruber TaxID=1908690 RepID=A0A225DJ27_9BACT|nr:phenylalanine--tRNA ligase subunit beta [Fimbriiglobus ruber]OWK39704.1 Phenylalanyl-tRNA synthetase beta chain [Fimbriiglobus ruber]
MLVPLNWLKDYVDLPANPAELVERLTLAGLEAGGVQVFGMPVPEGLRVKTGDAGLPWPRDQVVVAKVLEITKHPDADKLKVVKLDYGAAEPKNVITGAPNIAPGQSGMKVVLGLRGTRYFYTDKNGKKSVFILELKDLRGIPNDAMCMSNFELGIADDHDGIIILDDNDPAPGTPLVDVLGEIVVDLDVLPNMARCLAILGVAREVAALTGTTAREPDLTFPTAADSIDGKVKVEIADPKLCPRYSATIIRNITVGQSPRWMRARLHYAGMRPINNAVDVTNYVMLEYGQPLHAFDYDALVKRAGGKAPTIIVRPAKAGEKLKTLDGQDRELSPDNLVIADTAGPIALAGVMGGAETEVNEATKTILIESASFDFVSVRKTARQFTLFSEASTRFSRGVHPEVVLPAARRAAQLFHRHAGGEVLAGVVDNYPAPVAPQVIDLNKTEIGRLLGFDLPDDMVEGVLTALQFKVEPTLWGWKVTTPQTRLDIQSGPADLIEELARVSGYDRLPETRLALELPANYGNRSLELEDAVRQLLADAGLQEAITYSLTGVAEEAKLVPGAPADPKDAPSYVSLLNPISPERAVMRRTLLPGILAVAASNLKSEPGVAMFEIGFVYLPEPGEKLPREPRRLALVLSGQRTEAAWNDARGTSPALYDFYDLKGVLDGLAADLHLPSVRFESAKDVPHLHPGRAARVFVGDTEVGTFGELHPKVAAGLIKEHKIAERPFLAAELDLDALIAAVPARFAYRAISPFPPVTRDIAVVVGDDVPAEKVLTEVKAAGAELLEDVRLFDVYRGDSIPAGTKSLAYALTYRVADRELSVKEVDKAHQKIEGRLRHVLKAQIRGKDGV